MRQVRLVFWKDVRHLRTELGVYAMVLTAYALAAPQVWLGRAPNSFLSLFVTLLKILMGMSWLVLITRVVHADRLVGEEQFWITRPYRWTSLLGAKLLFAAACVGMPFVVMQWAMLWEAGVNPFAAKAAMALGVMRFALNPLLLLLVVASVTEGLAMAVTYLTGFAVVWAGLLQFILSGTDMRTSPPYEFVLFRGLLGGWMMGILILQYARRRTLQSRLAIVGLMALFLLLMFGYDRAGFGAPVKVLIRHQYPETTSIRLDFAASLPYEEVGEDIKVPHEMVEVKLPARIEGLPGDAKLRETTVAVEMEAGGMRYAPPWQEVVVSEHTLGFLMPKDIFEKFATANARLHLELGAEELQPARVVRAVVAERFGGPMGGLCSLVDGKIYCRYPYQEWVATRAEATTCGGAFAATLRHVPVLGTFDPVVNEALPSKGNVCAGDVIQFTEYGVAGKFRLTLDVASVRIGQYRARHQ